MRLPCHTRPGTPSTPCTVATYQGSNALAKALRTRARLAARLTRGSRLSVDALKAYRAACADVDAMRAPYLAAYHAACHAEGIIPAAQVCA